LKKRIDLNHTTEIPESTSPLPRTGNEDPLHWDEIARQMPDILPAASTGYYRRREIALIQQHFGNLRGKSVLKLDLWNEAVNTRILNWMESQGADAHGMDISLVTASRARANADGTENRLHLLQSDIRCIPYAEDTFDFVYTMGTIEHNEHYEQSIREIRRVLKPGGRSIIGVPHKWDLFLRPLFINILDLMGLYLYAPEKCMSGGDLRRIVENGGLKVRDRTGLLFMPGILRIADLFCYTRGIPLYKLTHWVLKPFEWFENRWEWARRLGYLLVIIAEK
jgi:SAM-dependent methyltransferase